VLRPTPRLSPCEAADGLPEKAKGVVNAEQSGTKAFAAD